MKQGDRIYIKRNATYSSYWNEIHAGEELVVYDIKDVVDASTLDGRLWFKLHENEISLNPEPLQTTIKPKNIKVYILSSILFLGVISLGVTLVESALIFWIGIIGFAYSINKLVENLNIKRI